MAKNNTISIVSLGCAKNQVDAEIMLGLLKDAGFDITENKDEADVIIVNTCGFIESAKTEAIEAILEAAEYKHSANCKAVIAAGCLTQRYAEDVIQQMPEVDAVLGINGYDKIVDAVKECLEGRRYDFYEYTGDISYIDSARILSTPKGSAYIKISEGCDNRCAYCAIPDIRGPFRSRTMESVVSEAKRLAEAGVKELVVVAQDTSRYGKDLYGRPVLSKLLYELDKIDGVEWIRVMYLYPDEIASELITAMKECKKVVPYVDLPLQHINGRILNAMNRRGTPEDIKAVLKSFREELPDCVIRTSVIVGFPGETEEEFAQGLSFIQKCNFADMHIFPYSRRPGTPADKMPGQHPNSVKEERSHKAVACAQKMSENYRTALLNTVHPVLFEEKEGEWFVGHAPNYVKVYVEGENLHNRILPVKFTALYQEGVLAMLQSQ